MSIKVNNLTKLYGTQKAVDNISFEIGKGITGFLGPNGAGKSTTMKIICGYLQPTSGNAWVNNIDISAKPVEAKRIIGYLPENNPLYPDMYIKEYLQYVADIYKVKDVKNRIAHLIESIGLQVEQHKKIGALSKGYRQRVGLAQALIHDPEVLILDEPTSGLDPNQIVDIRNLIIELGKHKTVLLSTHIMQEVESMCSQLVIINKGTIVANDKIEKVTAKMQEKTVQIVVEFDKSIFVDKLKTIQGVQSVQIEKDNTFLLTTSAQIDVRPLLFQFAVDNGLAILSQQRIEKSLEDVFQLLTNK